MVEVTAFSAARKSEECKGRRRSCRNWEVLDQIVDPPRRRQRQCNESVLATEIFASLAVEARASCNAGALACLCAAACDAVQCWEDTRSLRRSLGCNPGSIAGTERVIAIIAASSRFCDEHPLHPAAS